MAADLSHCTSNSKCIGYTGDDLKKAVKDCHVSILHMQPLLDVKRTNTVEFLQNVLLFGVV